MKKIKIAGNIFFGLTIAAPLFAFALASLIGEANIFGVVGIIRYMWIAWLFIPLGVASIFMGIKLKKCKQKYKKNFIVAFICLPLIFIFGSFRFIFNDVSYDTKKVSAVESALQLQLPKQVKIATNSFDVYDISYLKITDEEAKIVFENELQDNSVWKSSLNSGIKGILPFEIQYELGNFDCFVFYNITQKEYNTCPLSGESECIFVAYDYQLERLIIIDEWKVVIPYD